MARHFNASPDQIAMDGAQVSGPSVAYSIAFWMEGAAQAGRQPYSETNSGNSTPFLLMLSDDTAGTPIKMRLFWRENLSTQSTRVTGTLDCFDSNWHHVCLTQSAAASYALYIGGAQDSTGSRNTGAQTLNRATIGSQRGANYFTGRIAHVASWSRQLSAEEVKSLASGLLPSHLDPKHYWPLWGVDSPEPDVVSVGIDGTLTGTTLGIGGPPVGLSMLTVAA